MWWFFTLIMISSYTANLAAFLANEGMELTIQEAKDLPNQNKVKYGCVKGGTTQKFLKVLKTTEYWFVTHPRMLQEKTR